MNQDVPSKSIRKLDWIMAALVIAFSVLLAGAFLVSGIVVGKPGLVVCGLGWALVTIPIYFKQHPAKRAKYWSVISGVAGVLVFLLGLIIHAGKL